MKDPLQKGRVYVKSILIESYLSTEAGFPRKSFLLRQPYVNSMRSSVQSLTSQVSRNLRRICIRIIGLATSDTKNWISGLMRLKLCVFYIKLRAIIQNNRYSALSESFLQKSEKLSSRKTQDFLSYYPAFKVSYEKVNNKIRQ